MADALLQQLPQVDRLARELRVRPACAALEPALLAQLCERAIARVREALRAGTGGAGLIEQLPATIEARAAELLGPAPPRVLNATGILIHTNLGRTPLGPLLDAPALDALAGYSALEFDLESGERGRRDRWFVPRLEALYPGSSALAVNNCAAAMLLAINTFSAGKETILSRGELIEIGEGFRVPDIFARAGATLREVGTTNKTRVTDYLAAAGPSTGLLLRVHRSNFEQRGFVESATTADLAALGAKLGVPAGVDLGGGLLESRWLPLREETVRENLEAGADFVAFSGDKLFGGPQAGIMVGKPAAIAAMRANPLYRALRLGKETIIPLAAALANYLRGTPPPALAAAALPEAELHRRVSALREAALAAGFTAEIVAGESRVGGGAAPDAVLPTPDLALAHPRLSAAKLLAALRAGDPPLIARILEDRVRLNPRTLLGDTEIALACTVLRKLA